MTLMDRNSIDVSQNGRLMITWSDSTGTPEKLSSPSR